MNDLWTPPPIRSLPVRGRAERVPSNRLFFVGRNDHAHAIEMGKPVDKANAKLFYFTKAPRRAGTGARPDLRLRLRPGHDAP